MNDKYTYDLIEGIKDLQNLELDFDDLINEDDIESIEVDVNKIRKMTYKKIGESKMKKYKHKKILTLVASIALVLIIGTPVALAFVEQLYKYDKSSGNIIKSEKPLYGLEKPITKNVGNGKVTLNRFVVNVEENTLLIDEDAENIVDFEYFKSEIIVNGKDILEDTYTKITSNSWSKSTGRPFKYNEGDKIEYVIDFMDSEKNITKVKFDIDLVKATSVEEYNKNISKDIKDNVVLSAITKEENNYLYVEFMAIPNIENFEFTIDNYGNNINEDKGSGIFLVDKNNKKVEAEYVTEGNKNNTFKFDIHNLQKPFSIEVDEIHVNNENRNGKKVKLPKLKFGESIKINKIIDIEDKNNVLTKESHSVKVNTVERKNVQGLDSYVLDIQYLDNKDTNIELKGVNIDPDISMFGLGKFDFSSSSQEVSKDGKFRNICIYLQNDSDKNYKGRNKVKSIGFKMIPSSYVIKGNWKLEIS